MDYSRHYEALIQRARGRLLEGYVEVHHVLPRCMGGGDEKGNLVQLTPEEHFLAHQILCKIHPEIRALAFAAQAMTTGNKAQGDRRIGNKLFGWIRRRYAEAQKGRVKSASERANIAEAGRNRKRRVFSGEARRNMAEARKKTWQERRASGTASLIGQKTAETRRRNGTYEFSEEHKRRIGAAAKNRPSHNKGKKASEATKLKQSEAAKKRWASAKDKVSSPSLFQDALK